MKRKLLLTISLTTMLISVNAMESNDCLTRNTFFKMCKDITSDNLVVENVVMRTKILLSLDKLGLINSGNVAVEFWRLYATNPQATKEITPELAQISWNCFFESKLGKAELNIPDLHFENSEIEGFDPNKYVVYINYNNYDANGLMKEPVCGFDFIEGKVVPKYISVMHTVFRGFLSAYDYNLRRLGFKKEENKALDTLYGDSEIHKALWKSDNSFESPIMNLFAISGMQSDGKEIGYFPYYEQLFDLCNFCQCGLEVVLMTPFIPRIFAITYKKYDELSKSNTKIDLNFSIFKIVPAEIRRADWRFPVFKVLLHSGYFSNINLEQLISEMTEKQEHKG